MTGPHATSLNCQNSGVGILNVGKSFQLDNVLNSLPDRAEGNITSSILLDPKAAM
jgi:hypothetical protein